LVKRLMQFSFLFINVFTHLFLAVLGNEHRALCLLVKCSTT
jgi:hypothetical protein